MAALSTAPPETRLDWPPGAWPVLSAEQAAAVDAYTIETLGMPGPALMETAGRAVVEALRRWRPQARRVLVAAGPGNNGGDGFVVARYLHAAGQQVEVGLLGDPGRVQGDAALYLRVIQRLGLPIHSWQDEDAFQRWVGALPGADLVVDALFGTGLSRPLTGRAARAVEALLESRRPVLAIDIPSGIHGTSGHQSGMAIKADRTVTFGTLKTGQLLFPGAGHCGALEVADIGFPTVAIEHARPELWATTAALARHWLPARALDIHKGSAGRVALVGGSARYSGAPALASQAALRVGAGLSTALVPQQAWPAVAARVREVIVVGVPGEGDGYLGSSAAGLLQQALPGSKVLACGPGLGRHPDSIELVRCLLKGYHGAVVIDADGLQALDETFAAPPAGAVITPHAGEMATLLGLPLQEVLDEPLKTVRKAARRFGVVAILKGAHTLIADPDGRTFINCSGNPGMASAGMGDVLTGMVAGLLAQGASPLQAAVVGVYLHGVAGDLAAADVGQRGLLASDVSDRIPRAVTQVLTGDPTLREPAYRHDRKAT